MGFKNIRARINHWLNSYGIANPYYQSPQIDDSGLLTIEPEPQIKKHSEPKIEPFKAKTVSDEPVVVNTITAAGKNDSIEKMQDGFNRLIGQLDKINSHLKDQIDQQQVLMKQMNKLPELLDSLPSIAQNQTKLTQELMEQIKISAKQNEQFLETLEKIPNETAKQTDCLNDINHQLTASAAVDIEMGQRFNKFTIAMDKLNETSMMHADSINQMGRTFAASDKYLKYLIQKQSTRFTWIFLLTGIICLLSIGGLVGIILYLKP